MANLLGSTIGGHYYGSNNSNNVLIRTSAAGGDAGIVLQNSAGAFKAQIYGNGSDYGFLTGTWASWDLRKTISGAMYMNNSSTYYLNTTGHSYLSTLRIADASGGVSLSVGNGSTHGVYTADNARKYLVVAGDYYPHMALVASGSNNTNHGPVFSFVGTEGSSFRQWNLGISNQNPFLFSIGYNRSGDPNPHYGVGDGWSGDDNNHARLSIDRDGNTKIRGMLYVNGTSGGISTGNAVIHAGNIGSQSVSYADESGYSASSGSVEWTNVNSRPTSLSQFTNNLTSFVNRIEFQYNSDRYSQAWRNTNTGAYWWVTTDDDKLGLHRNGDGDKFYFSNGGDFWSSTNGWLSTALSNKQNASTAITTSNWSSYAAPRAYIQESFVDFTIYGDENTYYPVTIHNYNGSFSWQRYSIHRGYSDNAPWNPIGTGVHHGGLTFAFEWAGDIAWGGNDKSIRVIEFYETYTQMVAGLQLAHCEGVVVWLRGGGASGAYYRIHGPGGRSQGYTINMSDWTSCAGVTYRPREYSGDTVNSEINLRYPIRGNGNGDIYVSNQAVIHSGNIGSQSVSYASSAGNSATTSQRSFDYIYGTSYLESAGAVYGTIFYDNNDRTYYGDFASTSWLRHLSVGDVNASNDGGWNARLNLTGSSHARLDVKSNSDGIITTIYSHTGQGVGRVGTWSNHPLAFMVNGGIAGYAYANYLQGVDSVRAPIFYDSEDTGYYVDPNSTSNLNYLNIGNTREEFPLLRMGAAGRYSIGVSGAYTRISSHNQGSGVQLGSYDGTTFTPRLTVNNDGNVTAESSLRAPIFYDSNDTTYYCDPNAYSSFWGLAIRGDQNSTYGGNQIFFWGSGNSTTSAIGFKASGGQFENPTGNGDGYNTYFTMDSDGRGWVFRRGRGGDDFTSEFTSGWILNNGIWQSNGSMRAPIFYDSNDTGYYLDPNGTSNLLQLNTATRARWGMPRWWNDRSSFTSDQGYWTGTNGWGTGQGTWANAWQGGFSGWDIWGTNTDHPQGSGYVHAQGIVSGQHYATSDVGYGWMMVGAADATANRYWLRGKWGGSTSGWVEMFTTGNMDAPNKSGTSYYQTNTWMQFNGFYGLYWPSQYDSHLSPNDGSSYTQFRLRGNKNGYGGIYDSHSRVNGFMYDGEGNGGVYREGSGLWYFYYHLGNNCMGIGTSTTSNSYKMYVAGTIYATGDVIAYSDSRKKTNIVTIDNALEKVLSMRGVFYNKVDEPQNGRQVGVIAQEVNQVLPEAVSYASDVDEYGVKYGNIVGVLIEAIKEQQKQIEELKSIINGLT